MVKQFSRKQNQVSLYLFFQGIAQNVTWNQHTRWYVPAPPKLLKIDSASHIKKYRKIQNTWWAYCSKFYLHKIYFFMITYRGNLKTFKLRVYYLSCKHLKVSTRNDSNLCVFNFSLILKKVFLFHEKIW